MKYIASFVIVFIFYGCLGDQEYHAFPPAMYKMLSHHGGLTTWKKKETLKFLVNTPDGVEAHFVDLRNNRDRVEGTGYAMGYDGRSVWMSADTTFNGDPAIYHNLYSFFFNMPFLLANKGGRFSDVDPIVFGGLEYPGIKVTLEENINPGFGKEYFIHYSPLSYRMNWLGYTTNNGMKSPTPQINWVRYEDWFYTERLVLPELISWYKYENGELTEPKYQVAFNEVEIGRGGCNAGIFEKPEDAIVVE